MKNWKWHHSIENWILHPAQPIVKSAQVIKRIGREKLELGANFPYVKSKTSSPIMNWFAFEKCLHCSCQCDSLMSEDLSRVSMNVLRRNEMKRCMRKNQSKNVMITKWKDEWQNFINSTCRKIMRYKNSVFFTSQIPSNNSFRSPLYYFIFHLEKTLH